MLKQLGSIEVENFDPAKPIEDRVWHIRRPGPKLQSTLCGELHVSGETAPFRRVAPEAVCVGCLNRLEVAR